MANYIKWTVLAVLLVAVIAGAAVLYDKLSGEYGGNNLMLNPETEAPAGTESDEVPTETEVETDLETEWESGAETEAEAKTETETEAEEKHYSLAPDFTVFDREGNAVRLSDYIGKPVVLNFWATWCYYCKQEMPDFDRAYADYPDVQFLMVNATDGVSETVESATAYVDGQGFSFHIFFDTNSEAQTAYRVSAYPITYFINAKGELVAYGNGMLNYDILVKGIQRITK